MSEQNDDSKLYNARSIQRYLNGQMSGPEMHALELAALDDPFLADAIEGYDENNTNGKANVDIDLEDLKGQLRERVDSKQKNKVVIFFKETWWRAAAVLLITAGSAYLFYNRAGNVQSPHDTVVLTTTAPDLRPLQADTTLTASINKIDSSSVAVNDHRYEQSNSAISKATENKKREDVPPLTFSSPSSSVASAPVKTDSMIAQVTTGDKALSLSEAVSAKKIQEENTALRLSKTSPDTITGFSRIDGTVASRDHNRMSANRKSVVVGYANVENKEAETANIIYVTGEAAPVIGLAAYRTYLETNRKLLTDSASLHGFVVLSFMVDQNGMLTDYKLEKSLSKKEDNEAIRLIKEGPAWRVLKNQPAKATVTIKF